MSNQPSNTSEDSDHRLTSVRFQEFREALDVLFIENNISGRIKFASAWPEPALYVLGEALVTYDREGVQDRAHRAALEQEAEIRREALLETLEDLEEKSVAAGALQTEFVGDFIRRVGRDCALYVYSRRIVDRFAPPPPPADGEQVPSSHGQEAQISPPVLPPVPEQPPVPPVEKNPAKEDKAEKFHAPLPDPPAEDVQPISVGMPEGAPPAPPSHEVKTISGRFVPARKKTDGERQG